MSQTVFVDMYHPALGNRHVQAPQQAVPYYEALGWVQSTGSPPAAADIYLTPGVGDFRYAKLADVATSGTATGDALRAALVPGGRVPLHWFGTVDTTGATDMTAVINAAHAALAVVGGGSLEFPSTGTSGSIWAAGEVVVPNDGATPPKQAVIRWVGQGCHWSGRGTAPVGGTILNMTATASTGKVQTSGLGLFAAQGITFTDTSGGSTPFIFSTNTTLQIEQCSFVGSKTGTACDQDAIILGGTTPTEGAGGLDDGFQGYGTVISRNFGSGIRRLVYGRVYANAVVVRDNTMWATCGNSSGGAILVDGNPAANVGNPQDSGWLITGNLIEVPNYQYGIVIRNSNRMQVIGNQCYDKSGTTVAAVLFDNSQFNLLIDGFNSPGLPGLKETGTAAGTTTRIASEQSVATRFTQHLFGYQTVAAISTFATTLRSIAGTGDQSLLSVTKGTNPYPETQLASIASNQVADGVTTSGSAVVTSATASWNAQHIGLPISGTGIPTGALIDSVQSATSITLNKAATATATGVTLNYYSTSNSSVTEIGFNRRHLIAKGTAPTVAAGVAAGTSPTAAISGMDLAGSVTITTGTAPTTGRLANVTLNIGFGGTARPMITPANAAAAAVGAWADRLNSTTWTIDVTAVPAASTALKFNYWIPEAA